ncbi:MAG: BCCT family transporter [Pseudomonadota bacterium]
MQAKRGPLKGLNPTVALVSKALVIAFLLFGVLQTDLASEAFTSLRNGIIASVSWFYIVLVTTCLVVSLWLMASRFGSITLGGPDDKPEFGYFAWFSMLFAAGMGIGLVFWSIAEPIYHYQDNPFLTEAEEPSASQLAMRLTFFHWGLHPWGIYALVGLCLAYFGFRKGLPLTIRSSLYPLIGDRIYGPAGHAVDILAVLATTFGVATSLGLGAAQINTGLNTLLGIEISTASQLVIIGAITAIAVVSVVSGLERGVRVLSELNIWLALALVLAVTSLGPTAYLIEVFIQSTGDYLQNLVWLSLWTDADQNRGWQASWTTFYWGWWISWAPFVGMFIARISKGRTIREFVAGVLLVPTLVTFLWLSIMGGTAIDLQNTASADIVAAVNEDVSSALYATLAAISPGVIGTVLSIIATLLIATFFITSSDSGTLVVSTILSVGDTNPPVVHRAVWGLSEGAVAAILLLTGGLSALQAAAISAALPFAVIMVLMIVGLLISLHRELPAKSL